MADAPADRGDNPARRPEINSKVYDPANPNVYYNDPASKNALARQVLEDRSRARAVRGVEFGEPGTAIGGGSVLTGHVGGEVSLDLEDLHDQLNSHDRRNSYIDGDLAGVTDYSDDDREKMSTVEKQLNNDGMGSRTEDDETEAKKEKIRKRATKVAERKLRKVRENEDIDPANMEGRREILDKPESMGVTDEDVQGLLDDLGKK